MLLTKCKHCDGLVVVAVYRGQDDLKRHVAELTCNKGHRYMVLLPSAAPKVFEKTTEFPPAKGKWFLSPEFSDRASVGCPGCGALANVAPPVHAIDDDGKVTPSWTCPYGCGWHAVVSLADWNPS